MTVYHPFKIALSDGQQDSFSIAFSTKTGVTLRLKPGQFGHGYTLPLTSTQIGRIKKAARAGHGVDLKMSKTQMVKFVQSGGLIFSTALSLARPFLAPAAKAAGKALATAGLSFGAEKLLKKILASGYGPQEVQLYWMVQRLTPAQKKNIEQELIERGMVHGKGSNQKGGFLRMLASIGVPITIDLLGKLFRKGMHVRSCRSTPRRSGPPPQGKGMYINPPPPFFGLWVWGQSPISKMCRCPTLI